MAVQATLHKRFQEIAAVSAGLHVDPVAGKLRGVKLLGLKSKNGREYTEEAARDAVKLYLGKKVYLNHPRRSDVNEDRQFQDWAGVVESAQYRPGDGIYGDVDLRQACPHYAGIIEAATKFPHAVGFSHVADGDSDYRNGVEVVHRINEVFSVDLVTDPATTKGLYESVIVYSPGLQQIGGIIDRFVMAAKQLLAIEAKSDYRLPQNDLIDTLSAALKARDAELSKPENLSAIDPAREAAIGGVQSHLNKDFADLNQGGAMDDALAALDQLSALAGSNPQPVPANAMQPVGLGAMDFYGASLHGQPTCESHSDPGYETKFREAAKRSSNRK